MNPDRDPVECHWAVDGEGAAVTFIHGLGSAHDAWDGIVAELSHAYQCLRYDLRGHGQSPVPPPPYVLDDFVDDLAALLDARDIAASHLVGHSLGGLIAQAFALRHPSRVASLVLLSTVAGRSQEERQAVIRLVETLERKGAAGILDQSLERWFTPAFREAHPDIIEKRRQRVLATDPAAFAAAFRVYAESDFGDEISAITAPTLIMTGENDVGSNPRIARYMHDKIAGSQLVIIPDLHHNILLEGTAFVAGRIRDFLAGV